MGRVIGWVGGLFEWVRGVFLVRALRACVHARARARVYAFAKEWACSACTDHVQVQRTGSQIVPESELFIKLASPRHTEYECRVATDTAVTASILGPMLQKVLSSVVFLAVILQLELHTLRVPYSTSHTPPMALNVKLHDLWPSWCQS